MDTSRERKGVLSIAQSVLSVRLQVIEAAWAIYPFVDSVPELFGEDWRIFSAVRSETDHLPLGELRELWHPDVLPVKDAEFARCQERWREQVRAACERILLRGGSVQ